MTEMKMHPPVECVWVKHFSGRYERAIWPVRKLLNYTQSCAKMRPHSQNHLLSCAFRHTIKLKHWDQILSTLWHWISSHILTAVLSPSNKLIKSCSFRGVTSAVCAVLIYMCDDMCDNYEIIAIRLLVDAAVEAINHGKLKRRHHLISDIHNWLCLYFNYRHPSLHYGKCAWRCNSFKMQLWLPIMHLWISLFQ